MTYLWEQALQQLKRRKGKAVLLFLQLFLSLLIIQAALGLYQSKQMEYTSYLNAFGSDLYQIDVMWMGGMTTNPQAMPEQFTTEQLHMLEQKAEGQYHIVRATRSTVQVNGLAERVTLLEMDERLYRETVSAMGYDRVPGSLLSPVLQGKLPAQAQLGSYQVQTGAARPLKRDVINTLSLSYQFMPAEVAVLPAKQPPLEGDSQVWLKAQPEFKAADRARLLKTLNDLGGGQWEYRYRQVLELQEEEIEGVQQMSSMFLVFAGMILLIGTLGVLGLNLINFLSKRHEWAVHMVYGASRGDLILVQLLQYTVVAGSAWLAATGCANVFLALNDVQSAWAFGLGDLASLASVLAVGVFTLLPFFGLRQVRLTDALKQER